MSSLFEPVLKDFASYKDVPSFQALLLPSLVSVILSAITSILVVIYVSNNDNLT
jgi:hypothetical protein